jgi:4-hydroxy-2-oxoheptanedioate aldolase
MRMGLADKLAAGEIVFTAWSNLPETLAIESLCQTAFDAITLDMQHGGHSDDSVLRCMLPIVNAGKPGLVRIPVGRFDMASRALDFGAQGVIAPMINSADDARAFASFMKFPPVGERSWGPAFAIARRREADAASPLAIDNRQTMAFAMIETRRAYEALDDILSVQGIDGIFVGPSDFSIAWTEGARVAPMLEDMMEALADIAARARKAGKRAGIYLTDLSGTGRLTAMGYQLLAIGPEAKLMSVGAQALIGQARATIS